MKTYYQTTPVTRERVERLLASYGASPEAWPAEECEAALALLTGSEDLRRVQQTALTLDEILGVAGKHGSEGSAPDPVLVKRILDNLPEQDSAEPAVVVAPEPQPPRLDVSAWLDRILGWPGLTLAGTAVAVLFVVFSSQSLVPGPSSPTLAELDFDRWVWEEVVGDGVEPANDNLELDFMALAELSQSADEV